MSGIPPTRLAAMPGVARIGLLALVAVSIGACGSGGDSIPADQADVLRTRLDEIENAVGEGNCDGAQDSAALFATQVQDLPDDVEADVKKALEAGAERLSQLASDPEQCEPTGASGLTGEQPTTSSTVETTTSTTETTTSTEEEQPEETDQSTGEQGNGQDGGEQGGNEGGGGQGGPASGGVGSGGGE